MSDVKPIKIKAVVYWAFLDRTNDLSGQYQVDLGELSDAAVKALDSMGIEVKNKGDDRGNFITCKSKYEIYAFDTDKKRIEDPVGNGSEAVALIGAYEWKFKNKKGVSPSLKSLVITNLKVFQADNDLTLDDEEAL